MPKKISTQVFLMVRYYAHHDDFYVVVYASHDCSLIAWNFLHTPNESIFVGVQIERDGKKLSEELVKVCLAVSVFCDLRTKKRVASRLAITRCRALSSTVFRVSMQKEKSLGRSFSSASESQTLFRCLMPFFSIAAVQDRSALPKRPRVNRLISSTGWGRGSTRPC